MGHESDPDTHRFRWLQIDWKVSELPQIQYHSGFEADNKKTLR
jgi:hypothetical protein